MTPQPEITGWQRADTIRAIVTSINLLAVATSLISILDWFGGVLVLFLCFIGALLWRELEKQDERNRQI